MTTEVNHSLLDFSNGVYTEFCTVRSIERGYCCSGSISLTIMMYKPKPMYGVGCLGQPHGVLCTPNGTPKTVPGHHVQVDVKFLQLKDREGRTVKQYQYTAIDDASRIRALQIFAEHNQDSAIRFMDYVVERFPFWISTIRTDRGHEFQARFHWHVEDQGMQHVYIKPQTPQPNGKVERFHRTEKLRVWENFYNYDRPRLFL